MVGINVDKGGSMRHFVIFLSGLLLICGGDAFGKESKSLADQLRERAEASAKKAPPERRKVMMNAIEQLRKDKILAGVPKVGDKLKPFQLKDAKGKTVTSTALLQKTPLIVTFYRGGWCPYCNLQLRAFQKRLPEIQKRGAQLVAISPETADNSLSTTQKNNLEYVVLSDTDNGYAKSLGLVFELPKDLQGLYQQFGIDLSKANGSKKWELPLSATFVVDQSGKVVYSWANEDYKVRAPMDDVIGAIPATKSE